MIPLLIRPDRARPPPTELQHATPQQQRDDHEADDVDKDGFLGAEAGVVMRCAEEAAWGDGGEG